MTAADFRDAMKSLGLGPRASARLFGVSDQTVRKWAKGERPVPHLVARVVELMDDGVLEPEDLLEPDPDPRPVEKLRALMKRKAPWEAD